MVETWENDDLRKVLAAYLGSMLDIKWRWDKEQILPKPNVQVSQDAINFSYDTINITVENTQSGLDQLIQAIKEYVEEHCEYTDILVDKKAHLILSDANNKHQIYISLVEGSRSPDDVLFQAKTLEELLKQVHDFFDKKYNLWNEKFKLIFKNKKDEEGKVIYGSGWIDSQILAFEELGDALRFMIENIRDDRRFWSHSNLASRYYRDYDYGSDYVFELLEDAK